MVGVNDVVWIAVSLNAVGGIAVSMALKYADNILKVRAGEFRGKRGRKADGWRQRRGLDCGQLKRGWRHCCLDGAEVCGQYSQGESWGV
jgi:hypothetical protein